MTLASKADNATTARMLANQQRAWQKGRRAACEGWMHRAPHWQAVYWHVMDLHDLNTKFSLEAAWPATKQHGKGLDSLHPGDDLCNGLQATGQSHGACLAALNGHQSNAKSLLAIGAVLDAKDNAECSDEDT